MLIMIIVLGAFSLVVVAFLFVYLILTIDSAFGGEDFATGKRERLLIGRIIAQQGNRPLLFYDLGSGRGAFAAALAKKQPNLKIVGIDNSRLRTACARSRSVFINNVRFSCQDIFLADVSDADIVYVYLPQTIMGKLQDKLNSSLKNGAIVITRSVNFPAWSPLQTLENNFFIYRVNRNSNYAEI